MPEQTRTSLMYAGGSIRHDRMPATDVATAIQGMAGIVTRAGKVLHGQNTRIRADVEPHFRAGSFEIFFVFEALTALDINDVQNILILIFGANHLGLRGLISRIRRGKRSGVASEDVAVPLDPAIKTLRNDKKIRDSADRLVRPVRRKNGAEWLRIKNVSHPSLFPPEEISRRDFGWLEPSEGQQDDFVSDRVLRVITPSFRRHIMWRFQDVDGGPPFSALMLDQGFMKAVLARQVAFTQGDRLAVTLGTEVKARENRILTRHRVLKVHDHRREQ